MAWNQKFRKSEISLDTGVPVWEVAPPPGPGPFLYTNGFVQLTEN